MMERLMVIGLVLTVAALSAVVGREQKTDEGASVVSKSTDAQHRMVIACNERMMPVLQHLSKQFMAGHPNVTIFVTGSSTEEGLRLLEAGTAQMATLSRPIERDELLRMHYRKNFDPVVTPIALEAVAIYVHPDNPLASLTFEQIEHIFSGKINSWEPFGISYESFVREIPQADPDIYTVLRLKLGRAVVPPHRQVHGSTIDRIGAGIDRIGFDCYVKSDVVRPVALIPRFGDRPVLPTPQTIQSREYPLAHYLYVCTAGHPSGAAKEFITFVLSPEGQRIISETDNGPVALWFDTTEEE